MIDTSIPLTNTVKRIIIVGGGTAGWLTACHLGHKIQQDGNLNQEIILIESPNIPTIGVGEGTVPSILASLNKLGIKEADLIQCADATFKQSVKFVDWKKKESNESHYYHHVFDHPNSDKEALIRQWVSNKNINSSFVDMISNQGQVCDQHLAPKLITTPEFKGAMGYAYHFDAIKLAGLLTKHATSKFNVKHIKSELVDTKLSDNGYIRSITLKNKQALDADLFIDCTGFSSLLLGEKLQVEFIDKQSILFTDHAITMQIPTNSPLNSIPSYTLATAQSAGWVWDIGLSNRRGIGYVYSSSHTSKQQAQDDFLSYLRPSLSQKIEDVEFREIEFKVGYRKFAWSKNCVAIGLSQGFVEPLEATGILMIDDAAKALCELLPTHVNQYEIAAKKYNKIIRYQWDRIIDFIKLHYYLSDRDDNDFWRQNKQHDTMPESLLEMLTLWDTRIPSEYDFSSRHEVFYRINYLYILYGMGKRPKNLVFNDKQSAEIERKIIEIEKNLLSQREYLFNQLESNNLLISKIKKYGLQRI
ncbi:tryptophan halogenase family protein [Colwellia sp. UCD-KL20]|uniref:tryptophan halogenase family protein n=1 Tax=Colwellia sp. UCD-KL20 TaxID=1917165 RepID=UPI0009711D7F|nr:tryptophan halogenase family protein [Colwellia sp. UCD-KL20]